MNLSLHGSQLFPAACRRINVYSFMWKKNVAFFSSRTSMVQPGNPEWLCRVLKDRSPGPTIYRWTVDDIQNCNTPEAHPASDFCKNTTSTLAATAKSENDDEHRRIYILGIGNLGRLFASSLARILNHPPITLVVHRKSLLQHWHNKPGIILHPPEGPKDYENTNNVLTDFDVEMWSEEAPPWPRPAREVQTTISNLIVTTKAQDALPQVDWLRRYLGSESTVVFAQNGMNKLWPPHGTVYNEARYCRYQQRPPRLENPHWLACIVTHGLVSLGPFESHHASPAGVVIGHINLSDASGPHSDVSSFLVQQLLTAPRLNARHAQRPELWLLQLEKLVVNSVINPLTAILGCKNGDLFAGGENDNISGIISRLLEETSTVMQSLIKYDHGVRDILEDAHAAIERLAVPNLRNMLYTVGEMVKDNTSSMLQDVRANKPTEIDEFNGWIVEMAKYIRSLGGCAGERIDVAYNQALIDLVKSGVFLTKEQLWKHLASIEKQL